MDPTDAKGDDTKRRRTERSTGLVSSNVADDLEAESASPSSSTSSSPSPSTSSVASLQASATVSSSSENSLPFATDTAIPSTSSGIIGNSEIPKKRDGGTIPSSQTCKRSRTSTSTADSGSQAEPIDLEENPCEEVVDLTLESSDSDVVDLTPNDSVTIVEENVSQQQNQHLRSQELPDSFVLSSDDEPRDNDVVLTDTPPRESELPEDGISSAQHSGAVSCPVCMDGYAEIVQSGRLIVSTECGHVFCNQCLQESLKNVNSCPTCREKLGYKQYHRVYI